MAIDHALRAPAAYKIPLAEQHLTGRSCRSLPLARGGSGPEQRSRRYSVLNRGGVALPNRSWIAWIAAAWIAMNGIALSVAQDYPIKPVRTVIGFPPGGPNDLAMRPMAQKLQELLGQPFLIDYRPGANSLIGAEHVAKAPPDGYTLLFISTAFTINPSSYAKIPYDTVRDFVPISPLSKSDIVFVVNPVVPARSVKNRRAGQGATGKSITSFGYWPSLGAELSDGRRHRHGACPTGAARR
jgi:hypothetical protein